MDKESLEKAENFAKTIISLAAEEKLTVAELRKAADMAKTISENSTVECESVVKTDFLSCHICTDCDGKGLFG